MYNVSFHPAFQKDLKRLPKNVINELKEVIELLKADPFIAEQLKGELNEVYKYKIKLNNVDYRLTFTLSKDDIIFLMFKTRENYYKDLKSRVM